jgi:hypothetical protein
VIEASRRKYSIPAGDAQRLIAEEEATIIRSAQEKAAITGKKGEKENEEEDNKEVKENKEEQKSKPKPKKEEKGGEPLI